VRAALLALATGCLLLGGCLSWQQKPLIADEGARIVRLGDAEVHYVLAGPADAPPVVLVHGFGSSTDVWRGLIPALEADHRVLAVDLKGFGWTSRYDGDYSRQAQAELVLAAMDEVGVARADVVAHSMGSAVTLTMAAAQPDRVRRIVLVGPWLLEDQVPWGLRDARQPGVGELIFGAWFEEHLDWRVELAFAHPEEHVTQPMIDRARLALRRPGSKAAALATIRGLDLPGLEAQLPGIAQPTLIVQGAADRVARPEFAARLRSTLPSASIEELSDVGHFPMYEAPGALAHLVRGWLDGDVR
jgi:pimeloyl-ACP methyl ester carboxylesterase